MNKQIEYVQRMRCVEFQMGFEPTTFRIGPRNIYTRDTRQKVVIFLFFFMFVIFRNVGRTRKFPLVDVPCFDIPPNWTHQIGRGGLGTN